MLVVCCAAAMDALSWARRLLFPSPSASYDYDSYPSETVWIPRHPGAEEVAVEAARRWQQQQQREEQQQHSAHATTAAAADLAQQPAPPSPPPLPPKNAALPVFPSSSASSPSPTSLRPSTPSGSSPSTPPFTSASASASASVASSSSSSSPAAGVCGELPAFFLPSRGADLLVVHAHGNGIDIGGMHSLCRFYQTHIRAHFLLFEYPGMKQQRTHRTPHTHHALRHQHTPTLPAADRSPTTSLFPCLSTCLRLRHLRRRGE